MLRLLACCCLVLCSAGLPAIDEAEALAAARAASVDYQRRFDILRADLEAPAEAVRIEALRQLGSLGDPKTIPLITPFLEASHRSDAELIAAITVCGNLGYQQPVPAIRMLANHPAAAVRQAAMIALGNIEAIKAGDWMLRAQDDDAALRHNALTSLGSVGHAEAAASLIKGLSDDKPLIRRMCAIGLGRLGDRAHGEKLKISLTDPDPQVRIWAADSLARLNYTPAIPDLLMALESGVATDPLARSLRHLTKQDFGFSTARGMYERQQAVEKAFTWWTQHPELKQ